MADWKPIKTAPKGEKEILVTDGKWRAIAYFDGFSWRISHFAVCQEYEWAPTHWMPAPSISNLNGDRS